MKQRSIALAGSLLLTACVSQPATIASVQKELATRGEIDPIDPLPLLISEALAKDKNILRAYLAQKDADPNHPVYVLAPIFENEYPQDAIKSAYNAFYQVIPNGTLELWLVPKNEYKKHFAQAKPIYVRP